VDHDAVTRQERFVSSKEEHMAGTAFGYGSPFTTANSPITSWGLSPYGIQNQGIAPALQSITGLSPYAQQPLQQVHQLLQIIPQQLQALQQLDYLQQQQIQQLLQIVPAQLMQLQQLVQVALQQIQQTQQPLGQVAGAGGFAMTPWGITPQVFGAQPAQVM
jgi:UDP-galactopyranose mutase